MSLLWSLSVLCINDPVVISSCWIEAAKTLVFSSSFRDAKDAALFLYSSAMLGVEGGTHHRVLVVKFVGRGWSISGSLLGKITADISVPAVDIWLNPTNCWEPGFYLSKSFKLAAALDKWNWWPVVHGLAALCGIRCFPQVHIKNDATKNIWNKFILPHYELYFNVSCLILHHPRPCHQYTSTQSSRLRFGHFGRLELDSAFFNQIGWGKREENHLGFCAFQGHVEDPLRNLGSSRRPRRFDGDFFWPLCPRKWLRKKN